ncbi:hypothetical protein [Nocardioides nematodiphilus]|uniref:hypothetical protein n=1 Tax=Nocardioides nematodiphilus TaxID=2849669 RepID=UPI001CDA302F|nr:hypothetical protein [Nocardioides nematodiphilus]MCA1981794.1 hypothetical protein [Nocardioides nematodiphilus]
MTNLRTGLGALAATAALTAAGIGTAAAATHAPHGHGHGVTASGPCAIQQAQVDKAQAKLDALTAKFAAAKKTVKEDKRDLTHGSATGQEKKALAAAKEKKAHIAKAKKAQVQRLAHATARLQKCLAGVSATSTPTESESVTPSETATTTPTESASTSASMSASATA